LGFRGKVSDHRKTLPVVLEFLEESTRDAAAEIKKPGVEPRKRNHYDISANADRFCN